MKRFFSLLLCLCLCLSLLACHKDPSTTTEASTAETTTAPTEPYPLLITGPLPQFAATTRDVVLNNLYTDYPQFNNLTAPGVTVPGIDQKIVPQGMDIWPEQGWIMMSGYFSDNSVSDCSMIIAIDMATGQIAAEYKLRKADGSAYTGHVGGIAVTKKNLFVADGSQLRRIPLESLYNTGRQGDIQIVESINVPVRASFCNYSGGYLWVGDFYSSTKSAPPAFRHMLNRMGQNHYAWSVGYALDETAENEIGTERWQEGMEYATPDVILSITKKIQGMVVAGDHILLSQSYGRTNNSVILQYQNVLSTPQHSTYKLNDKQIPVWFLDGRVLEKSITAPPMSEGLAALGNRVYILFESAAEKYRLDGGKNPVDKIFTMDLQQ